MGREGREQPCSPSLSAQHIVWQMPRALFLATHIRENGPGHLCQAGSWRKRGSWRCALEVGRQFLIALLNAGNSPSANRTEWQGW